VYDVAVMSRGAAVYKRKDLPAVRSAPPNGGVDALEKWVASVEALRLMDFAFGSEQSISVNWSKPGEELGLPLIAELYERGFHAGTEWDKSHVNELERELAVLLQYWQRVKVGDELFDLQERAESLRSAIAIVRREDAVILIV
jgi:hypothetical protein